MGFPEETIETLEDTVSLIRELDIDKVTLSRLTPLPGTELFDQCIRDNLLIEPFDFGSAWENRNYSLMDGIDRWNIKPYRIGITELDIYYKKIIKLSNEKSIQSFERYNRKLANTFKEV